MVKKKTKTSNARGPDGFENTDDLARPTYIRCQIKHLDPETLDAYRLPWDFDPENNDYLIIKEYISHELQQELFDHTRRIRKQQQTDGDVLEDKRPTYIKVRRKYLSSKTLDDENLPWEIDPKDSRYLIIKEYLSVDKCEELFEHTRRLHDAGREMSGDEESEDGEPRIKTKTVTKTLNTGKSSDDKFLVRRKMRSGPERKRQEWMFT